MYEQVQPLTSPVPRAGFWPRVAARLIDESLIYTAALVATLLVAAGLALGILPGVALAVSVHWLGWLVFVPYHAVYTARSGQTPGKRLLALRVETADGRRLDVARAWARPLIEIAVSAIGLLAWYTLALPTVNYLLVAVRSDRRAGHDLAAGTAVIHLPAQRRPSTTTVLPLALGAFLLIHFVRGVVATEGREQTPAMAPTIATGERWVGVRLHAPAQPGLGDIVTFIDRVPQPAKAHSRARWEMRARRIVGVAGDRVAIRQGVLWRNGRLVPSPVPTGTPAAVTWPQSGRETVIPAGQVMVLGDNRSYADKPASIRGREPAPTPGFLVPVKDIRGRVVAVASPLWRLRSL